MLKKLILVVGMILLGLAITNCGGGGSAASVDKLTIVGSGS
ncbi:hypothetical protein [Rhodoferax sp.]